MESVLITGASGFIGSFIVEEALKRRFGVWAGIRSTSSKKYLKNRKIHFLELDFAHPNELRAQLSGHKGTYNKFDYIIHCAGVTKCSDKKTFDYVNYLQTKYFIDTLKALNMVPKQFIYISTLSVFGPVREKDYTPIEADDIPESLENKLNGALVEWEKMYGAESSGKSLAMRFEGIIKRACRQEGQRVVILVEEYDKPMLQAIGDDALQKSFRNTLEAFYGALKS